MEANQLDDMIVYFKTLSPVDNEIPVQQIMTVPRLLLGMGVIPKGELLPATILDLNAHLFERPCARGHR